MLVSNCRPKPAVYSAGKPQTGHKRDADGGVYTAYATCNSHTYEPTMHAWLQEISSHPHLSEAGSTIVLSPASSSCAASSSTDAAPAVPSSAAELLAAPKASKHCGTISRRIQQCGLFSSNADRHSYSNCSMPSAGRCSMSARKTASRSEASCWSSTGVCSSHVHDLLNSATRSFLQPAMSAGEMLPLNDAVVLIAWNTACRTCRHRRCTDGI